MNYNEEDFIIINNSDLYNFIYKFNSDGNLDKYFGNITQDDNNTFISYFDMEEYINEIKNSYKSVTEIFSQFEKDYARQNIELNSAHYYKCHIFLDTLHALLNNCNMHHSLYEFTYYELIVLLCCQSSFCLPYQLLSKLYEIDIETKILTCDTRNVNGIYINIYVKENKITMELNNILYIKKIETNKNTHKIHSTVTIELDKSSNQYVCIFSWTINNL